MDLLDIMKDKTKAGLRLTTIANVEAIESFLLHREASYDERQAHNLESKAKMYYMKSEKEEKYAERNKERSDTYARAAELDQQEATALLYIASQDDELREEIIRNITRDQNVEDELQNEIKQVHTGLCGKKIFSTVCDIVGGTADLQRQADEETLKIHHEMSLRDKVSKREFTEKLVAASLQGNATEYKETSVELRQTAEYWDKQSQQDSMKASQLNTTSSQYEQASTNLKNHVHKILNYESSNINLAERNFEEAEAAYNTALKQAILACVYAILAGFFFGSKVLVAIINYTSKVMNWIASNHNNNNSGSRRRQRSSSSSSSAPPFASYNDDKMNEVRRCVSYCVLHFVIFFITAGLCRDYVSIIGQYGFRERTAIITWFSFLGSTIQTFALHFVPHCMAEWPIHNNNINTNDLRNIAKHTSLRLVMLMVLFGIELLIVLVTVGEKLFALPVFFFFGNPFLVLFTALVLALHVHSFEPRSQVILLGEDDTNSMATFTSTITAEDGYGSHIAASEATPLTTTGEEEGGPGNKSNGSSATRVALLGMDLGRSGRGETVVASDLYSLDSTSPYYVRVKTELVYVKFALEVLFVCCMAGVLKDCLPLACHSILGKAVLIGLFVCVGTIACPLAVARYFFPTSVSDGKRAVDPCHDIEIVTV